MTARQATRKANLEKRNARIRELFKKLYTDQPTNPRKYTREYVIAQIAEKVDLSMTTVEDIIYKKEAAAAPAASETAQAA